MNSARPIKDEASAPGTGAAIIASKSTATQAQHERILTMLRIGEKSTFDFRRAGIMQTSTSILELRRRGYSIDTVARRDMFDADGHRHVRVAVYALRGGAGAGDVGLLTTLPVPAESSPP